MICEEKKKKLIKERFYREGYRNKEKREKGEKWIESETYW